MADASVPEDMDISKMKVPDLKRELKSRGLSTTGNKTDLMERLQKAINSKSVDSGSGESADDLDEDLLNDDDLDHDNLDASESVLTEIDEQLDASPPTATLPKRKISHDSFSDDSNCKPIKKIILNREPSFPNDTIDNDKNDANTNPCLENDSTEKKVVKLSELSAKERLEMRAKKFGAPTTVEGKKLVRAERFSSKDSPSSSTTPNETLSLDALKKRAERFGGSVSKVVSNLEQQDRLERRKARFGVITATNGSTLQTDKAKQRLERFKSPIK